MERTLKQYEPVIGSINTLRLKSLGEKLKGAKVVHVNSTKVGGGVAEILDWLVTLMNDVGLDASWEVLDGEADYFNVTKAFHNGLQGKPVELTSKMIQTYEDTVARNADRLRQKLEEADFVIIHDPQPAHLLDLCPNRKGKWIWRCHIDVSHPNIKVWNYIKSKVMNYDASIFSMSQFARPLPHPQFLMAPSIDPLSDKNCDLSEAYIENVMEELGVPRDLPILTQISRFDRFKDPLGVIQAFKLLQEVVPARLVLAGGGASDDPEGTAVYNEVMEVAEGNPYIHVLLLPGDAHRMINAIQRASSVIIQKSLQEGFGLTVTEGLWKARPVIGGNVGGIRLQVHSHHTGFLVDTPEGAALRLHYLLARPDKMSRLGETGKAFVKENFLLDRHLREYLTLLLGLQTELRDEILGDEEFI